MTTFRASFTSLTARLPQSRDLRWYVSRRTLAPRPLWLQKYTDLINPATPRLNLGVQSLKRISQKPHQRHEELCWLIMLRFLVNDQRDAQFFIMYLFLFLFLTLYMFRAHRAHHQERQIVSTQPLLTVILCRWPCRVPFISDTVCLSWWWAQCVRNV
jgi:hypothetical protein